MPARKATMSDKKATKPKKKNLTDAQNRQFAKHVKRFGKLVRSVVRKSSKCRHRQDDLNQAIWIHLITRWDLFKSRRGGSRAAWVKTVARRVCRNEWLKASHCFRDIPNIEKPDLLASRNAPDDSLFTKEELDAALCRLKIDHHRVLVLRFFQGFKYAEIAEEIGCATSRVGGLLASAKTALAKRLSPADATATGG